MAVANALDDADAGFIDAGNYRFRVLKPLAEALGVPKLNQSSTSRSCDGRWRPSLRRWGSVKDIQAHLWHARPDTTANEYMQELPESAQAMFGSVYMMLAKGGENQSSDDLPQNAAKCCDRHAN
jgi:hypothetical protein